jgi:hypothetical protein
VNVVLISRDHRLGAILTMALPTPEGLTLLGSAAEVPDAPEAAIDAVVLDLPADARRVAYEELRQRYEGRVVVPVDHARDTNGWPPDTKRRFLVRPFQVADLIAGVQEPQETSVAERAARYRRLFRWNRQQAPAFPDLATPPAAEQPPAEQPPAASAERFDEPFDEPFEAEAELHNNHVEDQESLAPEVAEDDEATEGVAAEEPLDADDEDLVAEDRDSETVAAEEVLDDEDEVEQPGAVEGEEAFEAESFDDSEDEAPVVAERAEDEEPVAAEDDEDTEASAEDEDLDAEDEAETQEFVAVSDEDGDEVEAEEQLDAEDEDEAAEDEAAEDDEPAVAAAAAVDPGERGAEDTEPSQEDDDLAAAWVAKASEPLPAGENGLVAAATGGPSTSSERAEALAPPLQVQAGVAMAKAVALQQWLEAQEAKRLRGRRRRVLLSVAAGLVLLLAGVGIGMAIGPNEPQQVSPPATPQPVVQIRDAPPPAACTHAMDDADAVISYLVAKIRDERLSKSIQDYGANARACRRTGRSP